MRRVLVAAVAVLAIGSLLVTGDAGAKRKKLPLEERICGELVDHSFRLKNDLPNCDADGLGIAPGTKAITINLNGHSIEGDLDAGDVGIRNASGRPNVTIMNGTIHRFGVGIDSSQRIKILDVTSAGNAAQGIVLASTAADSTIKESRIVGNTGSGIEVNAPDVTVTGNTLSANLLGVLVTNLGERVLLTQNRVTGSTAQGLSIGGTDGKFGRNVLEGNGTVGIAMAGQTNTISRNRMVGNGGDGYTDTGTSNNASNNVAIGNGYAGTPDASGVGFNTSGATNPLGSGNRARGSDSDEECFGTPPGFCVNQ